MGVSPMNIEPEQSYIMTTGQRGSRFSANWSFANWAFSPASRSEICSCDIVNRLTVDLDTYFYTGIALGGSVGVGLVFLYCSHACGRG